MYFVYNVGMVLVWLLQLPIMLYRITFKKEIFKKVKSYINIVPTEVVKKFKNKKVIWVHMASVGETVAANPIIKEIKRRNPNTGILVSCITVSGMKMAKNTITDADGYIYFPFDVPCFIRRVLRKLKPQAVILIETELWPNLLRLTAIHNIPVYLMNGRISYKSVKWYSFIRKFISKYFYNIRAFCMISQDDARNIIRIGAEPKKVKVTGNTKCEKIYNEVTNEFKNEWKNILKLKEETFLIIAGSTHNKEEKMLCNMMKKISSKRKEIKMIVAVRDINRAEDIAKIFKNAGYKTALKTKIRSQENIDVIILDTIGELGKLYSFADAVFIGGSLVPVGGHNLLEAAIFGKAIIVGQYMFNFKEIHKLFENENACITVKNENELSNAFMDLLENKAKMQKMGKAALKVANENMGAAIKNVDIMEFTLNKGEMNES